MTGDGRDRRRSFPSRAASLLARRAREHGPTRGVMLILTLWLVVVLSILTTSLLSHVMMQLRLMSMRKQLVVANAAARAGVAKAIADLQNDLILDYHPADSTEPSFDAEGDIWKRPEEGKKDQELGGAVFNVDVTDEESKININLASQPLLAGLLQVLGYEEQDAKDAAAAIVDWRDGDDQVSLSSRPSGATEGAVYSVLYGGGDPTTDWEDALPVRIKNEPFNTIDELLNVYGMTPEMYYGPESAEAEIARAEWGDQLAYTADKFQIKKRRSRRKDGELPGLREFVTVDSNGKINANTAPAEVLAALLKAGGASADDPYDMADRIVRYRRDNAEEDIDNNQAFRRVQDIDKVGELSGKLNQLTAVAPVDVQSETFTITSTGEIPRSRIRKTMQYVVRCKLEPHRFPENFDDLDRQRGDREHPFAPGGRTTSDMRKDQKFGPDEYTVLFPSVRVLRRLDP